MKKYYFCLVLTALSYAGCSQVSMAQENVTNQGVYVADSIYNFGRIRPVKKMDHTFILTNATAETVYINRVVPDCECTTIRKYVSKISPYGKTAIHATVDFDGRVGEQFLDIEVVMQGTSQSLHCIFRGEIIDVAK